VEILMTVDQKSVDDMARIMRALEGKTFDAPSDDMMITEGSEYIAQEIAPAVTSSSVSTPDIDAMKNILLKLKEADAGAPARISEASRSDSQFAEALVTDKTPTGVRIGNWEIVVNESARGKSYDVTDSSGLMIAKDLYLYDAAYGITKRLNEGVGITDVRVRDFLKLEEDYAKNLQDAATFKERAKSLREKGENSRAAIAEDRFDNSSSQALSAHDEILRLAGLR
jgi:hypothetical protein